MMNHWKSVCRIEDIPCGAGVCAKLGGEQVAIFRLDDKNTILSISNCDPFTAANVLSRGIIGEIEGQYYVASPLLKHRFCLQTGQCLDAENMQLKTWPTRVVDGQVQLAHEIDDSKIPRSSKPFDYMRSA